MNEIEIKVKVNNKEEIIKIARKGLHFFKRKTSN